MFKKYLTWYKPGLQFTVLLGLFLGCLALYSILSYVLIPQLSGLTFEAFQNSTDYSSATYLNTVIILQIVGSILLFLIPALLFAYFAYPSIKTYFHLNAPQKPVHWFVGVGMMLFSAGLVATLAYYNQKISFGQLFDNAESSIAKLEEALLHFNSVPKLFFTLFYIAFLPALCEELIFRGCIQNIMIQWFKHKPVWIPIVFTGVVFALLHGQMQTAAPRILLGILLGFIYYYSSSLWVSILAHFVNNGLAVLFAFLYYNKHIATDLNKNELPPIAMILTSTVLVASFFYYMHKTKTHYEPAVFVHEAENDSELFLKDNQ